jgi:hypothetical protein
MPRYSPKPTRSKRPARGVRRLTLIGLFALFLALFHGTSAAPVGSTIKFGELEVFLRNTRDGSELKDRMRLNNRSADSLSTAQSKSGSSIL